MSSISSRVKLAINPPQWVSKHGLHEKKDPLQFEGGQVSLGVPVTSRNRLGGSIDSPIGYRASCPTNGERLSIGRLVLIVRMEPSDYEGLIGHADPTPVGTA